MSIALSGFLLGISLIVAMGPQNILLIKQGIRREGITAVILVCFFSDVILYCAGALGVGFITDRYPLALDVLRIVGIVYLGWFAFASLRDALFPPRSAGSTIVEESAPAPAAASAGGTALKTKPRTHKATWVRPALSALALTWLNPGAYLDGMVMVGGIALQYGEQGRWAFIAGALAASLLWFTSVGYGAGALSQTLSRPQVWRVLNAVFGIILIALCVKLALM
ncbi:LysE/ArgO family amino acid transporter [Corynebacterium lowii]|uniref:Arginine exporter protein ArgO n=1 Tax=Corynebacterium lowii TaxID=1544413 RepID=A0A0Q0UJK4_9CORY|nr:LysE/ArgO family amino acid transporter [Corynebacterium lowii]KQB86404.1 Arginine exporter protein ArgO [Corynebacterium lowii]MDP9850889.1 L-lysine exporter family protein LysE/ArgO [Corynebacterium lowii]